MFKMNPLLIYFSCFLYMQLAFATTDPPHTSDSADFTFDYVNKARTSLNLTSNPNIILVTGITGGGKSTLTHYVTGNYTKMISVKPTGVGAEYRIYDELDPDVNHTDTSTVSRTFVPELNIDEEKNVFYDCPGFADTRNETVEIATTFLIKSVIENAKNIKIVLVVNYESVTDGHDRQDFDNSLARLAELVQNVTRFENSISMVITKVPSYFILDEKIVEVPESSIKISTVQFATDHRTFLQQKGSNESKKKIQLINALLMRTSNDDYPRISVFWRPMEAGPLDKIKKMVDGRQSIRNSILKQTTYTNFEKNDFGFPLSAETKLKISKIAQATIAQISSILNNVNQQLLSAIQRRIQSIDDFLGKFDAFELGIASIGKSHGNNEPATLNDWIERSKTLIRTHGMSSIDMFIFNQIARHENNLNMLKSIADGMDITTPVRDLIANSSTATKYQTIEHRWYSFLVHVFNFFSNYDVQKDVSAYNVANLADWGQINKPQGLKITAQTFGEFVKRLISIPLDEITPTATRLKELNDIIGITLRTPVQYECNGDTMTVKGFIGKSSDIQVTKCAKIKVKKINVYLMSTFYVDGNLSLHKLDELKIYAPIWSAHQAATFNLTGAKSSSSKPSTGKTGIMGSNDDNFFGYANEMTNGELLTITVGTGTGATGQTAGMIAYKATLIENMNNFVFKNLIEKMYNEIESNPQINQAYTVSVYADEANSLEKLFFVLNEHIDMYPLYRSLMQRIDGFAVANTKNITEVDRKVLSILYTTIFGKAASIRSAHKADLFVDVMEYLHMALSNVAKLDDIGRIRVISALRDQYRDELADKIKEAKNYIGNDIQPEIEMLFKNLNFEMEETVNETIALHEHAIKRKQELVPKLQRKSSLIKLFGVVEMVAGAASQFVSYANTVSVAINLAAGGLGGDGKVPELDSANDFVFRMQKINADEIDAIEKQLNGLKAFVDGDGKGLGNETSIIEIGKKLTDFAVKVSKIKSNPTFGATRSILKEVLEFVKSPMAAIKDVKGKVTEEFLKPFERATNVLSVVASSISTFKQYSNNDEKLQEIGRAIQRDRETLKTLIEFEDQIYEKMMPLLGAMQISLKNVSSDLANKTLVSLDMQKWKLAPTLRVIQQQFAAMLQGFGSEYHVANYLQRIEESMNLIINIYDRIQNYQEQTRFAIYMSDLQSVDYRNYKVKDAGLQNTVNELRLNLHVNILLSEYDRAVDVFKQAVFPFAADYLDIYELPKSLQPSKNNSMDSILLRVSENIKSLIERIRQFDNTVFNPNYMLTFNAFYDRYGSGSYGPFYVWKNDEVHEQIKQLFAGKKVYLLTDVMRSNSKSNAIKFKSIRLEFRSVKNDQNEMNRLNEILSSFHVSLTHMGESNYRCGNQFYAIHSRPLTIEYSLGMRKDIPTMRNWAYDKLNAVNPLLSPHTMWGIQLENGQFDRLKEFTGKVDLELHGVGQYVKETSNICNTNLEKYYSKKNAQ